MNICSHDYSAFNYISYSPNSVYTDQDKLTQGFLINMKKLSIPVTHIFNLLRYSFVTLEWWWRWIIL